MTHPLFQSTIDKPKRGFDRQGAKKAGYSDAEIDEYLAQEDDAFKPSAGREIAPHESSTSPATHRKDVTGLQNDWAAAGRELVQGATFGFGDEIEARVRSAGPRKYGDIRDELRGEQSRFRGDNPILAPALQIAGSVATGKFVPGLNSIKVGNTARMGGRAATAATQGAIAGGVGGVGATDGDAWEKAKGGAKGAAGGAALGAGFSVMGEMLRKGNQMRGAYAAKRAQDQGRTVQALPEDQAAERALATMNRAGKSVDDLDAWHAGADPEDIVAEGIGQRGVRRLGSAHRVGLQSDPIAEGLTERARNESGRVKAAVRAAVGDPVDDVAFKAEKLAEARAASGPLYKEAVEGRTITDGRINDLLKKPTLARAYARARRMAADAGEELPTPEQFAKRAQFAEGDVAPATGGRRPNKTAAPTDEELGNMSMDDLRKKRSSGPVETLTDKQLAHELHYLDQMHASDAQKASLHDLPEYMQAQEMRGGGHVEDAIGAVEHAGYDIDDWNKMKFEASAARSRIQNREPRLKALRAEMESRPSAKAAPEGVADATAHQIPEGGEVPSVSAKTVQWWKLALDDQIEGLKGKVGGSKTNRFRQLVSMRDDVEGLLYEHAPKWGEAQAAYAKPMQEATAFAEGVKGGRQVQAADVKRLLSGRNPEQTARGVGNTILEDLDHLGDGAAGPIRNPAPTVIGSERARSRLAVATQNDPGKIASVTRRAEGAARRLTTKNAVLGGSQTAERLVDDSDALDGLMSAAKGGPKSAILGLASRGIDNTRRALTGQQLDSEARILMAGAPGEMSRADAIAMLRRMLPYLERSGQQRAANAARAGSSVSRAVQNR